MTKCGNRALFIFIWYYFATDPSKFTNTTQTKAVYGVCVDLLSEDCHRVASYVENQVYIWDLRKLDKAVHIIPPMRSPIVKVSPCPNILFYIYPPGCWPSYSVDMKLVVQR